MSPRRLPALLLTALLLLAPTAFAEEEKPKEAANPDEIVKKALEGVRLGKPLFAEPLILIPLIADKKPEPLKVTADVKAKSIRITEPEWPKRRFNVKIENGEKQPVLMLGGNFLVGGDLDRLIARDLLIPAGKAVEIATLPAEYSRDPKAKETAFTVGVKNGGATAPIYIRERARFDPSRRLVPIFISHFLEFRDEADKRNSLAAVDSSRTLAAYCVVCQGKTRGFTELEGGKVVGFVSAVRGRLHVMELFGTNDLLRSYFFPILKAHAYNAAAVQLRAKKLRIPIPGGDDKDKAVAAAVKQAEKLLGELKDKPRLRNDDLPRDVVGDSVLIRASRSQGAAIVNEGRLVHAVIYADNPFEKALYSRPIDVPEEASGSETSFGEMSRREGRGTLSEAEKRLLERMRNRRR
jgi:hypothetical protein